MYDFHCGAMVRRYDKGVRLLYMDTNSYIYGIRTPDFYGDLKGMIEHFDTSEYPEEFRKRHDLPSVNRKVLGKMKDENAGSILSEFVVLKSKVYGLRTETKETKRANEVKKKVIEHEISFDDYKTHLIDGVEQYRRMNVIRSWKYVRYSEEVNRLALSPHDDNR